MFKEEIQFIACDQCAGTGKTDKNFKCRTCAGLGLGVFFQGQFLYWGKLLSDRDIRLGHLEKNINKFINFLSFFLGLAGLAALVFWLWQASETFALANDIGSFNFFSAKDKFLLWFWLSTIFDLYLIYSLSEDLRKRQKIKRGKIVSLKEAPNNWADLKKSKKKIDVSTAYGEEADKAIENAFKLAQKSNSEQIGVWHLFLSLLKNQEVGSLFVRLSVNDNLIAEKVRNKILEKDNQARGGEVNDFSEAAKKALIKAYIEVASNNQAQVKPLDLLGPILAEDEYLQEVLLSLEISQDQVQNAIAWFRVNERLMQDYRLYRRMARLKPGGAMNRSYTAVATNVLNHFSYDLTLAAKWGRLGLAVERDDEIDNIFESFQSGQRGVILSGPTGVGKKTIVYGIARLMVEEMVPSFFQDKRLVELDVARLISGASPAQAEERLLVMIDEIRRAGNIILFIDDIENIVGITAGQEESLELSEVLANALERNSIYCIASVTEENYNKYITGKALARAMAHVKVAEPVGNQAIRIIESQAGGIEAKNKVYFSYHAIEEAVKLSQEYMHEEYLPSKAIKILESTAVRVAKRCAVDKTQCLVRKEDIAETVSEVTKVPVTKITANEGEKLLRLEEEMHKRLIGQEEAVIMVANSLRRARTELREKKRPIASFLFLGPTGVGKTELAKTVSEVYFGDEKLMIRLDMSEYQQPNSLEKMIGDSKGNLGYLTEKVRQQPFALILLDELEKAHPDILNLFLQVMDDGRLTDGQGRTIDFTNSIIIATSNVGALHIQEELRNNINSNLDKIKETLINEHLPKVMRPELINRFDGIIVFKPLSEEDMIAITKLMLAEIGKMLEAKGVGLEVSKEGLQKIAREAYDPKFGARPLRRLLQEKIENKIAEKFLSGEIKRRDTVIINEEAGVGVKKGKTL